MSFTAKQLQEKLEEAATFAQENNNAPIYFQGDWTQEDFYPVVLRKICDEAYVTVKHVETNGGEGEGDYCDMILSTGYSGERFFKLEGQYSSYEGMDFSYSELQEVVKQEVKVMQWTPKK